MVQVLGHFTRSGCRGLPAGVGWVDRDPIRAWTAQELVVNEVVAGSPRTPSALGWRRAWECSAPTSRTNTKAAPRPGVSGVRARLTPGLGALEAPPDSPARLVTAALTTVLSAELYCVAFRVTGRLPASSRPQRTDARQACLTPVSFPPGPACDRAHSARARPASPVAAFAGCARDGSRPSGSTRTTARRSPRWCSPA